MKIEFRKVLSTKKDISTSFNSVELEGTFCKISPSLVKIESTLKGLVPLDCYKCGTSFDKNISEEFTFYVSDGIYSGDLEELIIEVDDGFINFDEIIESEILSLQSDYFPCKDCEGSDELINKEF